MEGYSTRPTQPTAEPAEGPTSGRTEGLATSPGTLEVGPPPSGPGAPDALRPIVLCADDFGLSAGVSEGILQLAVAGRISALSCMAAASGWREAARGLDCVEGRCEIGLHLTLTDETRARRGARPTSETHLPGLPSFMAAALARRLDPADIRERLRRQWEAFVDARGRTPDFVDGHQHAHLFPVVRDAVLDLLRTARPAGGAAGRHPWLRVCHEPAGRVLARGIASGKSLFLAALSQPLRRAAAAAGIPANDSFRGVRSFDPTVDYAGLFPRFLYGHARRPLIMCHPGIAQGMRDEGDPIAHARQWEFEYFSSERFLADLAEAGCRIVRFSTLASTA